MKLTNLDDLLIHQLKDLRSAEEQILRHVPGMARSASSPELKQVIDGHEQETRMHARRLDQIAEALGLSLEAQDCAGMKGILQEGKDLLALVSGPAVVDAALISAIQKVEHYEIAAYGCTAEYAKLAGHETASELLRETLNEEKEADRQLTQLAETKVNLQAAREPVH
jgi:ferritin-like metal-binding protein YciE